MKKSIIFSLLVLLLLLGSCSSMRRGARSGATVSQGAIPAHALEYLDRFSALAISEMERSGVPASITLAQGMLESNYGRSRLATQANNHFGIKCHSDWQGGKIYHDDNRRGECFRAYKSAWESYRDHSDFLVKGSRYRSLFSLARTDYKGWAHGLRKAGYATDPKYASSLIRKIEEYQLWSYDTGGVPALVAMHQASSPSRQPAVAPGAVRAAGETVSSAAGKAAGRSDVSTTAKPSAAGTPDSRVAAAATVAAPVTVSEVEEPIGVISFTTGVRTMRNNNVEYVIAEAGESYESLADRHQLLLWEITRYNDVALDATPRPGSRVYLGMKRTRAARGFSMHLVLEGETMHSVSQSYAIRLSSLYKLNLMEEGTECTTGQKLRIR